jgi:methyl-accepting chemotaxis protein
MRRTLLGLVIGGTIFLVLGGVVLAIATVSPLRHAVQVLERVVQGDLSREAEVHGRDEISRMSAALNTAIRAQRDATAQLAEALAAAQQAAERDREAARAGEAGAGFAAVAAEVRTLAVQAGDASRDIQSRVAAIQADAAQAARSAREDAAEAAVAAEALTRLAAELEEQLGRFRWSDAPADVALAAD